MSVEEPKPPFVQQTAIGDGNVQVAGDNNTVSQQITNYIPTETGQKATNQDDAQDFELTSSSSINQTSIGNYNTQISGNNNLVQWFFNFFRIDTKQQRALKNRHAMLELVKNTWIKGVLEKSLYNEILIQLGMENRPSAVYHTWDTQIQMPNRPNQTLPPGTSILQVFDEMNGAILILGEPGSGKTTILLELARDCIERAQHDHTRPIPVVFNLSSWNDNQSIEDWLVKEMNTKYNVPKKTAQNWVVNDELQLLLDG